MTRKILLFVFGIVIVVFTIFTQGYYEYNQHPTILEVLCNFFISFFYGYGLGSFYIYLIDNKKD